MDALKVFIMIQCFPHVNNVLISVKLVAKRQQNVLHVPKIGKKIPLVRVQLGLLMIKPLLYVLLALISVSLVLVLLLSVINALQKE